MAEEPEVNVNPEGTGEAKPMAEGAQATDQTVSPQADQTKTGEEDIPEELPSDPQKAKDAFIKMRQTIKTLKDQTVKQPEPETPDESGDDLINEFREPSPPPQQQEQQVPQEQYFDTSDPYTREMLGRMSETDRRAYEAQRAAYDATRRAAMAEGRIEDFEAESSFPQLKRGSDKYDPEFRQRVQEKYFWEKFQAAQRGKAAPRLVTVAARVSDELNKFRATQEQVGLGKAREQLKQEEQAGMEARSTSANVERPTVDKEVRSRKINRGDLGALADSLLEEDLANIDITKSGG